MFQAVRCPQNTHHLDMFASRMCITKSQPEAWMTNVSLNTRHVTGS